VLLGSAALFLALLGTLAIVAAARLLQGSQARFFGFAEKAGLHFLPGGNVVDRAGALRLRSRGNRLRRRLGRFGDGLRLGRLGRRSFTRTSKDAALLDLHDDRVRTPVAKALLDLA